MKKITNALIFLTGAVAGAAGAWYFLKEKYEAIAEEEIASVKAAYAAREKALVEESGEGDSGETVAVAHQPPEKPDIMGYAKKLQEQGYTDYSGITGTEKSSSKREEPKPAPDGPYVISPDEFGEIEGYTKISLTYFADGVVADEDDEPLDDPDDIIGDALDHFGEYEEDSVFIRNDARRCDYEILKDNRKFYEARRNRPPIPVDPDEDEDPDDEDEED